MRRHPVQRTGQDMPPPGRGQIPAQIEGQHLGRIDALVVGLGEVVRAVVADDATYVAGLLGVTALPLQRLHAHRYPQHRGQRRSRGAARGADAAGIHLVLGRIGPQPTHCRLDVVDGGRELVLGGEPIAHRDSDVALLRQAHAEAVVTLARSGAEAAAVDQHDRRERSCALLGPRQVDLQMLTIGVRVFEASFEHHVVRRGGLLLTPGRRERRRGQDRCRKRANKQ